MFIPRYWKEIEKSRSFDPLRYPTHPHIAWLNTNWSRWKEFKWRLFHFICFLVGVKQFAADQWRQLRRMYYYSSRREKYSWGIWSDKHRDKYFDDHFNRTCRL